MADQTRRQFLKLLGRGAGASVIPKNPLLNVFKQRALTGTPIQNESVRIMQEQIAAPENVERNRESLLNALSTAVGAIPQGRLAKGAVNIGTKLFKQFMKRPPKREEAPTGKQLTHYDRGDPVMLEKLPGDEVYTDTRSYNPTQQAISNSRFDVRPEQSELKVSEQAKDIISGRIRGVVSDKEVQDFVRSKSNKLDNTLLDELQEAIDLDKDIPF